MQCAVQTVICLNWLIHNRSDMGSLKDILFSFLFLFFPLGLENIFPSPVFLKLNSPTYVPTCRVASTALNAGPRDIEMVLYWWLLVCAEGSLALMRSKRDGPLDGGLPLEFSRTHRGGNFTWKGNTSTGEVGVSEGFFSSPTGWVTESCYEMDDGPG